MSLIFILVCDENKKLFFLRIITAVDNYVTGPQRPVSKSQI